MKPISPREAPQSAPRTSSGSGCGFVKWGVVADPDHGSEWRPRDAPSRSTANAHQVVSPAGDDEKGAAKVEEVMSSRHQRRHISRSSTEAQGPLAPRSRKKWRRSPASPAI